MPAVPGRVSFVLMPIVDYAETINVNCSSIKTHIYVTGAEERQCIYGD